MNEPQIWTVIGFTGALFLAFLAYVDGGLRDNTKTLHELSLLVQRHDFRFEKIEETLEEHGRRFDTMDRRFDGMDRRFDGIDAKLADHDRSLAELRALGENLGRQFFSLAKKLDEHLRGHAS